MSKKAWTIFVAAIVVLFGGLIWPSNSNKLDISKIEVLDIQAASDQNGNIADHVFGKADSKVVMIEYSDFQCSGCATAYARIKLITEEYKNQLAFVARNFPITSAHPNAKAAAAAVEAAGLQGKYWEMHDKFFESQNEWSSLSSSDRSNVFIGYARELDLNEETFKTDMTSSSINKKIAFDKALANKSGIDSTPTLFLNGIKLDSAVWSNDTKLKEAINTELVKYDIDPPTQAQD
jgi:protein-disulfide isomerase